MDFNDSIGFIKDMFELMDLKKKMLQAEIEMNGMIAENKQREVLGHSMAYNENDFISLIERYELNNFN